MALPIKDTPVLRGKDAQKLIARMATASRRKIPKRDYDRAQRVYQKMTKTFPALA